MAESDGAVCVTKAVADELSRWIGQTGPRVTGRSKSRGRTAAPISIPRGLRGFRPTGKLVLDRIRSRPSSTVGTLEPRKGHSQVLGAFDELWQTGANINLVIVGQRGWMVGDVLKNLQGHPELNKRLFWLKASATNILTRSMRYGTVRSRSIRRRRLRPTIN